MVGGVDVRREVRQYKEIHIDSKNKCIVFAGAYWDARDGKLETAM